MKGLILVLFALGLAEWTAAKRRGPPRDEEGGPPGGGFGRMGRGHHRHPPPPENMTECITRIEAKVERKMAKMDKGWEKKETCMNECTDDSIKSCMDQMKSVFTGMKTKFDDAKAEIVKAGKEARDCLVAIRDEDAEKTASERRCSEEAINFGPCNMGIIKAMTPRTVYQCVGKCMRKQGATEDGEDEDQEGAELESPLDEEVDGEEGDDEDQGPPRRGRGGRGRGGKRGRGGRRGMKGKDGKGKRGHGRGHHGHHGHGHGHHGKGKGKHMCLKAFCKHSALKSCGDQAKMQDAHKAKRALKEEMHAQLDAMFPTMCQCMKDAAVETGFELPDFIKDAECADLPNKSVCQSLHEDRHSFWKKMKRGRSESEGKGYPEDNELSPRQKRSVEEMWNSMDDFDVDV